MMSAHPANSDYFPVLDQNAPRARFRGDNAMDLRKSRDDLVPVVQMLDAEETRTPLERIASAGVNRPVRIVQTLAGAESIGVFLTGKTEGTRVLLTEDRATSMLGQALLARCAGAEREWADAITAIIGFSSPYLRGEDVRIVFDTVKASSCWKTLGETARSRILLLEAMNDRDAERMLRHGSALLARPLDSEPVRKTALLAAVTGAIVLGRLGEARTLWDRHVRSLSKEARGEFVVRLLHAHLVTRR
jgi:hypothetical protein